MKKASFILFFAAFLGSVNAQSFELVPNDDNTGFVIVEKGENEVFSDSSTIVNEILSEIAIAYSGIARSKKHIYLQQKKANTLNAALKEIYPDSSYAKFTKEAAKSFISGKWRVKINGTTYQAESNATNTRIKDENSTTYWTINFYSPLLIELKRVDVGNGNETILLFRTEQGIFRSKDNDPTIVLRKKI